MAQAERDTRQGGGRSVALDVFRGISVAGMILVTDPGSYAAVFPQLLHANWRGATATDMIFPGFLFAMGAAVPLSLRSRARRGERPSEVMLGIARRTVLLLFLGLLLNAYPAFRLDRLRIPGVLQRIGVCFFASAALTLWMRHWTRRLRSVGLLSSAAALLLGYGLLLRYVPVPGYGAGHLDTLRSLPAFVDRRVFTVAHLWAYGLTPGLGVTFDPEGLLSTLPAIASVLFGVVTGEIFLLERPAFQEVRRLLPGAVAVGLAMVAAGVVLDRTAGGGLDTGLPMIKKLWTPSFALMSSGVSLLGFALCFWLVDLRGWRRGVMLPLVFGTNAIAAFVLSGVLTSTLDLLRVSGETWHAWGYRHLFLPWLPPVWASLTYATTIVLVNCAAAGMLYPETHFPEGLKDRSERTAVKLLTESLAGWQSRWRKAQES